MSIRTGTFVMPKIFIEKLENYLDHLAVDIHKKTGGPELVCALTAVTVMKNMLTSMEECLKQEMQGQDIKAEFNKNEDE